MRCVETSRQFRIYQGAILPNTWASGKRDEKPSGAQGKVEDQRIEAHGENSVVRGRERFRS